MKRIKLNPLSITLLLDAILALGFGLYSWLFPYKTFGTILKIPEIHSSVFLSILSNLSLFYQLIGLTSLIGFKTTFPINL